MTHPTTILGISAYYHDAAAALVRDGDIVAAAQEERFTRIKGDPSFPHHAVSFCLETCGLKAEDIDYIVFYEDPVAKFDRIITGCLTTAPFGLRSYLKAIPAWLADKVWMEAKIAGEMGVRKRIYFSDHHLSHAAGAFYPSPFEKAAIITVDGVGEHSTTTIGLGEGKMITLLREIRYPNSLGLLYSAFTYFAGFKINSGEYKLMGLAPYGRPVYADLIREKLCRINEDGSFVLNQKYFDYTTGLTMTNRKFDDLFGGKRRRQESEITQREMDMAASIQEIVNEAFLRIGAYTYETTGLDTLVLAGGVALNVVAAGLLSRKGPFRHIWTQPAAGDAGGSLGAALWFWHEVLGNEREVRFPDAMKGAFLGTDIRPRSLKDDAVLQRLEGSWEIYEEDALSERIAACVADGKIVAVARGPMEFGPRALGARSILGDARIPDMQRRMNLKIKFRESFRPFAPMVLAEDAGRYFAMRQESPYMTMVYDVVPERRKVDENPDHLTGFDLLRIVRSEIPAVTHVDYSARVQTVDQVRNPFIWRTMNVFNRITGCSVMVNTSFNVRGEPIVNSIEDAYRCFMATDIDWLVIGNRLFDKKAQKSKPLNAETRRKWLGRFELD